MSEIVISLTDFVDFVAKKGSPKLTKVQQVKNRDAYDPSKDYWKNLRDQIVKYHRDPTAKKKDFDTLLVNLPDHKKNRYPESVEAYKKYLGRKKITFFEVSSKKWKNGDLLINVNPELGLIINGKKYIVKLYFKDEKLTSFTAGTILELMQKNYTDEVNNGIEVAVLDVTSRKLRTTSRNKNLEPLLIGEAASFQAIWKSI